MRCMHHSTRARACLIPRGWWARRTRSCSFCERRCERCVTAAARCARRALSSGRPTWRPAMVSTLTYSLGHRPHRFFLSLCVFAFVYLFAVQVFEQFYRESFFFRYLLGLSSTLRCVSNLGDLWFREGFLQATGCIQVNQSQ